VDFSPVEPGYYVLRAIIGDKAGFSVTEQLLIQVARVAAGNGAPASSQVLVLDDDAVIELPEGESLPGPGEEPEKLRDDVGG
jgi:hypothetical protein